MVGTALFKLGHLRGSWLIVVITPYVVPFRIAVIQSTELESGLPNSSFAFGQQLASKRNELVCLDYQFGMVMNNQSQPHYHVKNHNDFGIAPVVVHHAGSKEAC